MPAPSCKPTQNPKGPYDAMLTPFAKLYDLLEPSQRRGMWLVFALTVAMATLDTIGIASVMPFISVLSNPEMIKTNPYLAHAYHYLGFTSEREYLLFLGLGTFILLISSVLLRSATLWAQLRFTNYGIHGTGYRMVRIYLGQPFEWFLNHHSSDLATRVLAEVTSVFQGAFYPAMLIVSNVLVTGFLVALLTAIDPFLSGAMVILLGGTYVVVLAVVRKLLVRVGEERMRANHERYRVLNEAFGGIKDVKAAGLEATFAGLFCDPSKRMARRSVTGAVISDLPSFALQGLVFGGMLLMLLYLINTYGSLQNAIPIVAIYALAGYRLLPALQGVYRNLAQLRFNLPSLNALHSDLVTLEATTSTALNPMAVPSYSAPSPMGLHDSCELQDIGYAYPQADGPALHGINLKIRAKTTVGLVGASGSGKTTLVDVILGLLAPSSGRILVDGTSLTRANQREWQRSIGYVSQNIFLAEGTIASNIAFAIPKDQIDMTAVERAACTAQLQDLIAGMPDGFDTCVGEKGVRLSGGQRQRIGIARALYRDPSILILDEATAALDNITELAVMKSIHDLAGEKTILLIAHRLSSVRACDEIHFLDNGRVAESGTFDALLAKSPPFRAMVESGQLGASGRGENAGQ